MIKNTFFESLESCYIIAEIGVNHDGKLENAFKLIDAAKQCGADAVKFQSFDADRLVIPGTPKVAYQKIGVYIEEDHHQMLKKLELTKDDQAILKRYCDKKEIEFMSTPYDVLNANFLHEQLNISIWKTSSADIVDYYLHSFIAKTKKPTIISTGMATLGEIELALKYYNDSKSINLALLHCVSNYPCTDQSLNLNVLKTLELAFDLPIGLSDHTAGNVASIMSIALGSKVIEKHFTLDKNLKGPDHKASSNPQEFSELVESIRRAEILLGNQVKELQTEEIEMSKISRKSIVMAANIKAGDLIKENHICLMRPGTGLPPSLLPAVLGCKARVNLFKGDLLKLTELS